MTAWRAAAIDLGAESGRVVTGELDGDSITLHETHRFANLGVRVGGHAHWDARRLFREVVTGLGRARTERGDLGSVGVDTWGVDFALPARLLPALVPPVTDLGPLVPAVRDAAGLGTTRVVAPASHDTASAVAAIPVHAQHSAYISSGTWSAMGAVSPEPVVTEAVHAAGFTNEGGVQGTTRPLKNITGLGLVQECRRSWAQAGDELDYAALTALGERTGPFDAVVDPDDPSLLSPDDMPRALAELGQRRGEKVPSTQGELVRVALESLGCKYRQTLEQLEAITGHRIEVIHVVGGGSKNTLLCQLTAELCNRPVLAGPVETPALGNLLAQAPSAKVIGGWQQARTLVRQSCNLVTYHPRDSGRWESTYHRFCDKQARPTPPT